IFTKVYKARHLYPLTVNSFDDGINSYKLPSLGYEITDHHLPRGFVTSRKLFTNILCDYLYCDCTNYTNCLNDDNDVIKSNVEAIKVSIKKDLGEKEFVDENVESANEDNSDAEDTTSNIAAMDNLLEQAKKNFFEL
ncbi:27932_t:CDS:2, partial [Gigaspora margarita]